MRIYLFGEIGGAGDLFTPYIIGSRRIGPGSDRELCLGFFSAVIANILSEIVQCTIRSENARCHRHMFQRVQAACDGEWFCPSRTESMVARRR
jgi:hypothetical protein